MIFREPATWKRYRGGTASKLWLDENGHGEFVPFLRELVGQVADPVWWGERLAFVSDHEGHANVYSATADGTDLRRHTDHEGVSVRDLAGDGRRLVYRRAGELYLLESAEADSQPTRIAVELPGTRWIVWRDRCGPRPLASTASTRPAGPVPPRCSARCSGSRT
jgi:tricorn protease